MVKPKSVGDIMTARSFFNTHGAHLLEAILNIKSKKKFRIGKYNNRPPTAFVPSSLSPSNQSQDRMEI